MSLTRGAALLAAAIILLIVSSTAAPPTIAQSGPDPWIEPGLVAPTDSGGGHLAGSTDSPSGLEAEVPEMVSLIVRLDGPTIWELKQADMAWSAATGVTPMSNRTLSSVNQALERAQEPAVLAVESAGGRVIDRYQNIMNGLLVHSSQSAVSDIARAPGVLSVARAPMLELATGDSVPHIRAPQVWYDLGYKGRGTLVAVLDTGVDYTHAAFGGSGVPDDYFNNNEDLVESGTFPTRRVPGGYDFAGKRYSPTVVCGPYPGQECHVDPRPDDDPLDSRGHGTHAAGIIAGAGTDLIASGVAPQANLVPLKIFGNPVESPVVTDLMASAFEWVNDNNEELNVPGFPTERIDVVNLSVAGSWLTGWTETEAIMDEAAARGLTVVIAAGNDGALAYRMGPAASANNAVSVGSTFSAGKRGLLLEATWTSATDPGTDDWLAFDSQIDGQPSTAELGGFESGLAWMGRACPDDVPVQDVAGKVALIERGGCSFVDKIGAAQVLGAVGVVIFTDDRDKAPMGGIGDLAIGSVMIDRAPGLMLKGRLEQGTAVHAKVYEPEHDVLADVLSTFSSRGPARFSGGLKPQLMAPGHFIQSAWPGSGNDGQVESGTSMSSAHIAGVAALIAERNREESLGLDATEIGALAINYAFPTVRFERQDNGRLAPMARQGAGRVDAYASMTGETVIRSDQGIAELGMGHVHTADREATLSRQIAVHNLSDADKTYSSDVLFAYPDEDADQGVTFETTPPRLTVAPGQTSAVEVKVTIDPTGLRPWALTGREAMIEPARLGQMEIDGLVRLTETDSAGQPIPDGDKSNVPFLVLPIRHSCVTARPLDPFALAGLGDVFTQKWRNTCLEDAEASVFSLVVSDGADTNLPGTVDIEYVGMRYRPYDTGKPVDPEDPEEPELDTEVEWLISTRGSRAVPAGTQFRIYLDLNQDGAFDWVVFNMYGPELALWLDFGLPEGRWVVAHAPVTADTLEPIYAETAPAVFFQGYELDDTTVRLSVIAEDLGLDLTVGNQQFDYAVSATDINQDYPLVDGERARDLLPEGLFEGERLTYDQWLHDCFTPTLDVALPAGSTAELELESKCRAQGPDGEQPLSLLFGYTNNPPEGRIEVRHGILGGELPVENSLFMPVCQNGR